MKEKNFILGVGGQKCGTTWLYRQLNKSKNVNMGFDKEYHVFDALYLKECRVFLNNKLKKLKKSVMDFDETDKNVSHLLMHINFYLDTDNYYDYFDCLWRREVEDVTSVGDFTPSYASLPIVALKEIKYGLESRGFNVKVIFLMRDPIERCWSMLRMHRRQWLKKNKPLTISDEQSDLAGFYKSKPCEIRTRYELTINNLESVFCPENIFYAFYETLFDDCVLNGIKSFLNLSDFAPDIKKKYNITKKTEQQLRDELGRDIFSFYKETYEFCDNKFGVRELWNGWRFS